MDATYYNETVSNWVDHIHASLSNQYQMKPIKIKEYGFHAYASVLGAILPEITMPDIMSSMRGELDISKYVEVAHGAWSDSYIKWKRIHSDGMTNDNKRSINTSARNDRATTCVENLNEIDLGLYRDIINIVFDILTKKILNVGMQMLAI